MDANSPVPSDTKGPASAGQNEEKPTGTGGSVPSAGSDPSLPPPPAPSAVGKPTPPLSSQGESPPVQSKSEPTPPKSPPDVLPKPATPPPPPPPPPSGEKAFETPKKPDELTSKGPTLKGGSKEGLKPLETPKPPAPPKLAFGGGAKPPAGGLTKARRLLKFVSIIFIIVLVGFLGYTVIKRVFLSQKHQDVTLTYWGLWEDQDLLQPIFNNFKSSYEEENPNISLTINYEVRKFGDLDQHKTTILSRLQGGTGPDIVRIHNSWVKDFSADLAPLPATVMSENDYANTFYSIALSSAKVGDNIYALPLEYDGLVLYYNKDLMKGVANIATELSTWEGFRREAVKHTTWKENDPKKKITQAGAAFGTADNISHASDLLSLLLRQSGIDPMTGLKTQAAADALKFYTNFSTVDHIWDETLPSSIKAFANGQVAMVFGPSWRALEIKNLNPQLKFAAVPVPQLPGAQTGGVHWASFWMEVVNGKSQNAEIAWELIKYLSEETQQQTMFSDASKVRYFGEPYSRSSLADSLKTHEILGAVLSGASNAYSGKTTDASGNDSYVEALGTAIAGSLEGKKTEAKLLETAQKTIDQLEGVTVEED